MRSEKFVTQQEEGARDQREPELVHPAQQIPVELEAELLAAVQHEHGIHGERPREVPDDHADRALVERDDQDQRRSDRDENVRDAR